MCILPPPPQAASPADSALCTMLQDLANGPEGVGLQLLELWDSFLIWLWSVYSL